MNLQNPLHSINGRDISSTSDIERSQYPGCNKVLVAVNFGDFAGKDDNERRQTALDYIEKTLGVPKTAYWDDMDKRTPPPGASWAGFRLEAPQVAVLRAKLEEMSGKKADQLKEVLHSKVPEDGWVIDNPAKKVYRVLGSDVDAWYFLAYQNYGPQGSRCVGKDHVYDRM
jgi:hypothetical protein